MAGLWCVKMVSEQREVYSACMDATYPEAATTASHFCGTEGGQAISSGALSCVALATTSNYHNEATDCDHGGQLAMYLQSSAGAHMRCPLHTSHMKQDVHHSPTSGVCLGSFLRLICRAGSHLLGLLAAEQRSSLVFQGKSAASAPSPFHDRGCRCSAAAPALLQTTNTYSWELQQFALQTGLSSTPHLGRWTDTTSKGTGFCMKLSLK